uniref:Uncharacterized protein n=1 Tax=Arundo donax TaxID=35708 RepID=A0A0A9N648_ARUDO
MALPAAPRCAGHGPPWRRWRIWRANRLAGGHDRRRLPWQIQPYCRSPHRAVPRERPPRHALRGLPPPVPRPRRGAPPSSHARLRGCHPLCRMAAIHRPAEASPHENSTLPSLLPPYKAKSTIAESSPRCGRRCRAHGRAAGLFSTGSRSQSTTFPPNRGQPRPSSSSSGCRTSIGAVELRLQSLQVWQGRW